MELRQLRSFRKIAELGSFSRAANVLCLTQPALGLQIKNLEEELGVALLTRHSRGVALTPQGSLLLKHAESILTGVDTAVRAVRETQAESPKAVRIGMAPSLAAMLSVSLSQRVAESQSGLRLDLTEAPSKYLSDWVADGEIDLAIACEGPVGPKIDREVVLEEALYLVQPAVPNEPAIGRPIDFADLADMPLFVADPLLTRRLVDKLQSEAAVAGIRLHIRGVLPSMNIVKNLVEDGEGATVLPYAVVKRECDQNRLRIRKIVGPTLTRNAYMLSHRERPQSTRIRELIRDVISDQIRGTPEHGTIGKAA
ncbi:LysR family transcriptional regulator [Methylobacterium aquaticum]|uniref:HTH lysR-type domain-containing protein n=1 Tax=Methylobacterium aquaticum TaxID=270351 RepID=A0A0J6SU32_9HYPH|nr:LysR family transcriptional regulator [Methylobacterium aquaticum]KMO36868.1 hypothetical protein VP06_08930 [Methylobacterium aquaticum]